MKICYAHDGLSLYDHRFIDFLLRSGDEVHLVTFSKEFPSSSISRRLVAQARSHKYNCFHTHHISIGDLSLGKIGRGIQLVCRAMALSILVRKIRPDLLIGCTATTYGFYAALSHFSPFVLMIWGSDVMTQPKESPIVKRVVRFSVQKSDIAVVDGEAARDALLSLQLSAKFIKFPWSVDLEKFNVRSRRADSMTLRNRLGWVHNPIVICTRLHEPIYGIESLIRAIPHVIEKNPDVRFLIVGSGSLTEDLKELVHQLTLHEYVKFTGEIEHDEIPSYYAACDVYVSPSFSDGTSGALLEAMASNLPVIVTNTPGNHEWVEDGVNGMFFRSGDSRALADVLLRVLSCRYLSRLLAENARETVEKKADIRKNLALFRSYLLALREAYGKRKHLSIKQKGRGPLPQHWDKRHQLGPS